ncbi:MAG TPA: FAD-dependent monooxygenase [Paracoccaceae bacterium]|nr:FAD-dependent monooxygenase [Paracoccaceae bacterium]
MRGGDIAIAGAGPAGTVAAILLARAGWRVALVAGTAGVARIEGASPRTIALLARLGLPAAGIGPAQPRETLWGGMEAAPNREHVVDRVLFDAGLLAAAEAGGVRVVRGQVRRILPEGGEIVTSAGVVRAGRIVEARGRRAPGAAARLRGPASIAIAGWATEGGSQGSRVEGRSDGWLWQAEVPGRGRWMQVVTGATGLPAGRAGLAAAWTRVLGPKAPPLPDGATARACELRLNAPTLDPMLLRLGDAAIAMDPLSGHGLFWAVSSALLAVPILRALEEGRADLARRFWTERVAATFWRQARIGRDFHRAAGFDTPFWAERAAWPDDAPAHAPVAVPFLRRQVVVEEGSLREAEVLVTGTEPEGVAFLHGVALGPLLRALGPGPLPGPERLSRHLPGAPPGRVAAIRDWLSARGLPAAAFSMPASR